MHGLTGTLVVVVEDQEVLIGGNRNDWRATITHNADLVLIARQFVWMELFAQRLFAQLGPDLLARLDPEYRQIFESLASRRGST
jgi:Cd2+/Zn2+-exporting ATPase